MQCQDEPASKEDVRAVVNEGNARLFRALKRLHDDDEDMFARKMTRYFVQHAPELLPMLIPKAALAQELAPEHPFAQLPREYSKPLPAEEKECFYDPNPNKAEFPTCFLKRQLINVSNHANVCPKSSMYTLDWTQEFPSRTINTRNGFPRENEQTLKERVKSIVSFCRLYFNVHGDVYIGKTSTTNLPDRFNSHKSNYKAPYFIAMVTLHQFTEIPPEQEEYRVGSEMLALIFEEMLTAAAKEDGLKEDETIAGGGRKGAREIGLVYMMMVLSKKQ